MDTTYKTSFNDLILEYSWKCIGNVHNKIMPNNRKVNVARNGGAERVWTPDFAMTCSSGTDGCLWELPRPPVYFVNCI